MWNKERVYFFFKCKMPDYFSVIKIFYLNTKVLIYVWNWESDKKMECYWNRYFVRSDKIKWMTSNVTHNIFLSKCFRNIAVCRMMSAREWKYPFFTLSLFYFLLKRTEKWQNFRKKMMSKISSKIHYRHSFKIRIFRDNYGAEQF